MRRRLDSRHHTELRPLPAAPDLGAQVLGGVTARWSSTGEVAGRAGVQRASPVLYGLASEGLVEVTPPSFNGPRWRLTQRGAAELRDLAAKVAPSTK